MTDQQKILDWLNSLPSKEKIEIEAGLQQGYLSKDYKWRESTLTKVLKVAKKYGFKFES